jgi:hypothetical protein
MAARNTIEVIIKGEDDASSTFKRVSSSLLDFGNAADNAYKPVSRFGSFIRDAFSTAAGMVIANAFGNITEKLRGFGRAMIDTNSDMEVYQSQFTTLLGSEDAAVKRLAEITEFAKQTPFDLPGVIQANRMLTLFGEGVLDTTDMMRLVGDAASGVNADFTELSTWVGRAYSAIQAGRPFGEASMRLQELGLLTGEQRSLLEDMSKAGADSTEIWNVLTGALGRFSGEMETQSKTFVGISSNISDTWEALTRTVGKPIFDAAKRSAQSMLDFLSSDFVQQGAVSIAAFIENAISMFSKWEQGTIDGLMELSADFGRFWDAVQTGNLDGIVEQVYRFGTAIIDVAASIIGLDGPIQRFGNEYEQNVRTFTDAVMAVFSFIQTNGDLIRDIFEAIGKAIVTLVTASKGISIVTGAISLLMGALNPVNALVLALSAAFFAWDRNLFGIRDTITALAKQLSAVFGPAIQELFNALSAGNLSGAANGVQQLFERILQFIRDGIARAGTALLELGRKFFEWIAPQIPNILNELNRLLASIGQWIAQAVPQLANQMLAWASAFLDWIIGLAPKVLPELLNLLNTVINWIVASAGSIAETLVQWAQAFWSWVGTAAREILPKLGTFIAQIAEFLISEGIPALVGWIGNAITTLVPKLVEFLGVFVNFFVTDFIPTALQAGIDIVNGIFRGLMGLGGKLVEAIQSALVDFRAAWDGFFGETGVLQQAIRYFAAGVLDQLANMIEGALGLFSSLGIEISGVTEGIKQQANDLRIEADSMAKAMLAAGRDVKEAGNTIENTGNTSLTSFTNKVTSMRELVIRATADIAASTNTNSRLIEQSVNASANAVSRATTPFGQYASAWNTTGATASNASVQIANAANNAANQHANAFNRITSNSRNAATAVSASTAQQSNAFNAMGGAANNAANIITGAASRQASAFQGLSGSVARSQNEIQQSVNQTANVASQAMGNVSNSISQVANTIGSIGGAIQNVASAVSNIQPVVNIDMFGLQKDVREWGGEIRGAIQALYGVIGGNFAPLTNLMATFLPKIAFFVESILRAMGQMGGGAINNTDAILISVLTAQLNLVSSINTTAKRIDATLLSRLPQPSSTSGVVSGTQIDRQFVLQGDLIINTQSTAQIEPSIETLEALAGA